MVKNPKRNSDELMASYRKALKAGKLMQSQRQALMYLKDKQLSTTKQVAERAAAAGEKIHQYTGRLSCEFQTFETLTEEGLVARHAFYTITAKGKQCLKDWKAAEKAKEKEAAAK
jgi:hypothetical protein